MAPPRGLVVLTAWDLPARGCKAWTTGRPSSHSEGNAVHFHDTLAFFREFREPKAQHRCKIALEVDQSAPHVGPRHPHPDVTDAGPQEPRLRTRPCIRRSLSEFGISKRTWSNEGIAHATHELGRDPNDDHFVIFTRAPLGRSS